MASTGTPNLTPALTQEDALKILINAAVVSQKRGVFSLDEAAVVHRAVQSFTPPKTDADADAGAVSAPTATA